MTSWLAQGKQKSLESKASTKKPLPKAPECDNCQGVKGKEASSFARSRTFSFIADSEKPLS